MQDLIETKRLILRKFNLNDLNALFTLLSDEKVNTFLPWFTLKTLDEVKRVQEEGRAKRAQAQIELRKIETELNEKMTGLSDDLKKEMQ